ncbi:hypothetical protein [Metabacillus iocasae]|uniref:Uncharacterized protein n=1 Tax=Priestia iocasae TaxID=2291674 RepID=A0ABS2QVI4_9BACI|nr:hypothetical protein [Metabacillus iocasae]MBM7703498.1 hypothetical protein [Metabacillus iocasae]
MAKTVCIGLASFVIMSALLLFIGATWNIKWLMFQFYNETATGFEAGGSVLPFIIAISFSYFIGRLYEKYVVRID